MTQLSGTWNTAIETKPSGLEFGLLRTKKILIVDDEKEIRDLIRETLKVDNFSILESETGEDAWRFTIEEKPDLILLDILLPGEIDGLEVCKRIKSHQKTRNIPVIFITAVPLNELQSREMKAEWVFYKPFSPIQLINSVYEALGLPR